MMARTEPCPDFLIKRNAIGASPVYPIGHDFPPPLHRPPFLTGPRHNARHLVAAAGRQRRQGYPGALAADFTGRCREALVERAATSQDHRQ